MLALRGMFVVLVLLFSHSLAKNSYMRYWNKVHDLHHANLTKGTLFINNADTFPLASCVNNKPNRELTCTITITKPDHHDRVCKNIKITAGKDRELFLGGYFQVLPISYDKVLLAWYDVSKEIDPATSKAKEHDLRLVLLDFEKCKTDSLAFAVDKIAYGFFPALVFYKDKIDFILNSKLHCGGFVDRCRLSFNYQGRQIPGINPYEPEVSQYASAVSPSSPDKGFFMSNQDPNGLQVLVVDSSGKGKELLKSDLEPNATSQLVTFSNGHELYGTCWSSQNDIEPCDILCAQFDATGKQKFKIAVKIDKPVRSLSVRNIREGGLFLVAAADPGDVVKKSYLYIFRIDKNGNLKKLPPRVEGPKSKCFKSTSELEVRVYENSEDKYCFDYACLENKKELSLRGKCIPSADLQGF